VGHAAVLGLGDHVTVELAVDDLDLVARECAGVFPRFAQGLVVEQIFAPDLGAEEGEVGPFDAELGREPALQGAYGALARGRGALELHDHRPLLAG
jgi:hypothetical protein